MFQNEVAIEQERLNFGQEIIVAIEIAPAGLHQTDFGIGEMVNRPHQEIGRGNEEEIRAKD